MDVTAAESTGGTESDVSIVNVQNNWTNPMLLSPVIKCLCQFLNLEDVKNCRLAAREWALNSKLRIRALSKIVLSNEEIGQSPINSKDEDNAKREGNEEELRFTISKFFEDFPDALNIPFTAFKFKTGNWKANELSDFFKRQQENLRELELNCVRLLHEENYLIREFNITPWIVHSSMTKPNVKYNTKLAVNCHRKASLSVSLSAMAHIKDISLKDVTVIVDNTVDGVQLHPIELKLNNVQFSLGNIEFHGICINDIIDFSKSKDVDLRTGRGESKITLDVGGNEDKGSVNLDSLTLEDITVSNWANSKLMVKKLNMAYIPLLDRCGMSITELEFSSDYIDLGCLPQSIEMLTLHDIGAHLETGVINRQPQPPILQNLRYLYLNIINDNKFYIISYFKNCPQLVDLRLEGEDMYHQMMMKFDYIPKSIKRLKVTRMPIMWVGEIIDNRPLVLDRLILYDYSCNDLKDILIPNIQVKEIIMDNSRDRRKCNLHKDFIAVFQHLVTYSYNNVQRLFAGPFHWGGKSEPEYYVFENQRCVAIEENEFQKLKKII